VTDPSPNTSPIDGMDTYEHESRPRPQRIVPAQIVVLGVVAAAVGWAVWFTRERPVHEEVELLPGTMLPAAELAVVGAAFDRAQLSDHRTDEGRIWVPRQRQSAYMRALVDAEALPREFGSSLRRALEKNSPWQSRTVQEEMLRVAMQEELAHVILSMPGIERAAVLYDCRERGGFEGLAAGPLRTASVTIRTLPDVELEPSRVQAIRVLVAASIAGLDADSVAVTDLRSGRVHTGPLAPVAAADEVDPVLARQAAHERHLAAKLRQALAYVKGAVVDVSVTLAEAEPPRTAPPADEPAVESSPVPPEPRLPGRLQRVADANTPAELEPARDPLVVAAPHTTCAPAAHHAPGPVAVRVSIGVPITYLEAVVQTVVGREPASDAALIEAGERQRLAEVARHVLPATLDPRRCEVIVTDYPVRGAGPVRGTAAPAGSVAPAGLPPAGSPDESDAAESRRTPGQVLDAAWDAVLRRDVSALPREASFIVITLPAALLVWLVLRGGERRPSTRPRRRGGGHPSIDWTTIETDSMPSIATGSDSRKVAA
jgi:type III secretory pathway lipoprotein EscJ